MIDTAAERENITKFDPEEQEYCKTLLDEIDKLKKEKYPLVCEECGYGAWEGETMCPFCELLDKHRWVPVSERLPEIIDVSDPQSVAVFLVHKEWKTPTVGIYLKRKGWVIYSSYQKAEEYQDKITHWKPITLPEQAPKASAASERDQEGDVT